MGEAVRAFADGVQRRVTPARGKCAGQRRLETGEVMCSAPLYLSAREVAIAVVHRLELTAVDGDARRQQAHLSAKLNEARAYLADRGPVVLAEIGNGFVIGNKPPQQPHHLEIATASRSSRRLDCTRLRYS
jgi:hypothetical protein